MKITSKRGILADGLASAASVISNKTALPILSNVLVEAADGQVSITGTSLDVTRKTTFAAEVEGSGSVTLPGRRLLAIIRELETSEVAVSVEKAAAVITAGTGRFKLIGLTSEEFPAVPDTTTGTTTEVSQADLRTALERTLFAAGTDEARYILTGILFEFSGTKLTLVATDGRRMSIADLPAVTAEPVSFVLPGASARYIADLAKGNGSAKLTFTDNSLTVSVEGGSITAKLLEGKFPNYRAVIPAQCTQRVSVALDTFRGAISRASLLSDTPVILAFTKDAVLVSSNKAEVGEAAERVAAEYDGPDTTISFNADYLLAVLPHLKGDRQEYWINPAASAPLLIQAPFTHIIMPLGTDQRPAAPAAAAA